MMMLSISDHTAQLLGSDAILSVLTRVLFLSLPVILLVSLPTASVPVLVNVAEKGLSMKGEEWQMHLFRIKSWDTAYVLGTHGLETTGRSSIRWLVQ